MLMAAKACKNYADVQLDSPLTCADLIIPDAELPGLIVSDSLNDFRFRNNSCNRTLTITFRESASRSIMDDLTQRYT